MSDKTMNRWIVAVGAILIQLCLGAIYAWSVFTPSLVDEAGDFQFTKVQTQIIFSAGLAVFAITTVIAGRIMPKFGPRRTAMLGGTILGAGYILAGLVGTSFYSQLVLIGIVGGAGIGLGYVVPIAVGIKWFPDKKGLISGLGVAGFGFGATLWVKMGEPMIAEYGVMNVFLYYGIIFFCLVFIGSLAMVNPPEGYAVAGAQAASRKQSRSTLGQSEYLHDEMLKTRQFWTIWIIFMFGALAGLMVIGNIKLFGISSLQDAGMSESEASVAAGTAMAFYAIANGIGRIAWGTASDKLGRPRSILLMSLIQGIMMLLLLRLGTNVGTFTIAAIIIGFNFGGNFALFPTITADYFGSKSVGKNYGYTFTSYGVGGIVGPILGGMAATSDWGYSMAFIPAGVMCLIGACLALSLTQPFKKPAPEGTDHIVGKWLETAGFPPRE